APRDTAPGSPRAFADVEQAAAQLSCDGIQGEL
ncbi:MAG: hypothetical protein RLZZ280_1587, partial [Pseudomonadota bacterium]